MNLFMNPKLLSVLQRRQILSIVLCLLCTGLLGQKTGIKHYQYSLNRINEVAETNLLHPGDAITGNSVQIYSRGAGHLQDREIRLDSIKNKVVIMEFWTTWCGPCIPALQRLNKIQKEMGSDKLMVIAVSNEKKEDVLRGIRHMDSIDQIYFSSDTSIWNRFAFKTIPHTIVIDKNGLVAGETFPDFVTKEKLEALAVDKKVSFPSKTDFEQAASVYKAAQPQSNSIASVMVTGYDSTAKTESTRMQTSDSIILKMTNFSIPSLFRQVFRLPSQQWIIDSIADPSATEYKPENLYSLSVKLPAFKSFDDAYQLAQTTLNNTFKFKATWVKQVKKVYVLSYNPDQQGSNHLKFNETENTDSEVTSYGPNLEAGNITSYDLTTYLSDELGYRQDRIVLDETNLKKRFDIQLKWEYADMSSLFNALKKYGLYLKEKKVPVNMLLIK